MPTNSAKPAAARRIPRPKRSPVPASILVAALFAMFTLFLPYPVIWFWSHVAPTEVVGVQIEERRAQQSYAYTGRGMPQSAESYRLMLRRDDGSTRRVDVGPALYRLATGAFDSLNTLGLEQTRILKVPVRLLLLPDDTVVADHADDGAALTALAQESRSLHPNAVLALGALALNGLMLSLLLRPARVPLDRRIVWGGGATGFLAGMIWMLA